MNIVREYFAIVGDCLKWSVEDGLISARLNEAGYPQAEIETMQPLFTVAESAYNHLPAPLGDQVASTQVFIPQLDCVRQDLSDLRAMMKNNLDRADPLFVRLGLNEQQPKSQDDLLGYAVRVFTTGAALPTTDSAPLAKRKWDPARFTAALKQATQAQALNDQQEAAKSAAVAATSQLYDLIDALDARFRPFAKDARRVLEKIPGALDKMQLAKGVPEKPRRPSDKKTGKKSAKSETE